MVWLRVGVVWLSQLTVADVILSAEHTCGCINIINVEFDSLYFLEEIGNLDWSLELGIGAVLDVLRSTNLITVLLKSDCCCLSARK